MPYCTRICVQNQGKKIWAFQKKITARSHAPALECSPGRSSVPFSSGPAIDSDHSPPLFILATWAEFSLISIPSINFQISKEPCQPLGFLIFWQYIQTRIGETEK